VLDPVVDPVPIANSHGEVIYHLLRPDRYHAVGVVCHDWQARFFPGAAQFLADELDRAKVVSVPGARLFPIRYQPD
jgi:hypothetical protein